MTSRSAWLVGALIVVAMVTSILLAVDQFPSIPVLVLSMATAGAGVVGILAVKSDPMRRRDSWAVASTGPVACLLTLLDTPRPLVVLDQTNVLGVGVIVCAFLSVRGRPRAAWTSLAVMIVLFVGWGVLTGQGVIAGLSIAGPNVAVLGMSTLIAVIIRPAAEEIRRLRAAAVTEAATLAAARARRAERDQRRAELRALALPALTAIASGEPRSVEDAAELALLAAQLRDGVRAKALKVPAVIDAARAARLRGVDVVMFDDGALDDADAAVRAEFRLLAAARLWGSIDGTVTLRVHPPGRDVLATIVAEPVNGTGHTIDFGADGKPHQRPDVHR